MLGFLLTIREAFCSALAAMSSNWKEAYVKCPILSWLSLRTLKEVLPLDLGACSTKSPVPLLREADDLDENDKNRSA